MQRQLVLQEQRSRRRQCQELLGDALPAVDQMRHGFGPLLRWHAQVHDAQELRHPMRCQPSRLHQAQQHDVMLPDAAAAAPWLLDVGRLAA